VCIDDFRRQKHTAIERLHTVKAHHITKTHPCASQTLEQKELRLILRKAIQQLRGETRQKVFYLCYTEELLIKERAKPINRHKGTVKTSFL